MKLEAVVVYRILFIIVAEVVPLKQGLKPIIDRLGVICGIFVAEVVPLKQGLKPSTSFTIQVTCLVAEVVPLKQGLKLLSSAWLSQFSFKLQR